MKTSLITFILLFCLIASNSSFGKISENELHCLAEAMYFEARGEGNHGLDAVALVTINRKNHKDYPGSICGVVYQKGQYSWTKKKKRIRNIGHFNEIKERARETYNKINSGNIPGSLKGIRSALYFTGGNFRGLKKVGKIKNHNFYTKKGKK